MTSTRIPPSDKTAYRKVPDSVRPYLDNCRECTGDSALWTPDATTDGPGRIVAAYRCDRGHTWTRGYSR